MARAWRRTLLGVGAALLLAAVPQAAGAQRGAAGLGDHGWVVAKSVERGTVEIGGRTYELMASTVLEDLEGRRMALADLPVQGDPPFTMGQREPGAVTFRATQRGGDSVILRLRLVPAVPK